jgi:Spy/CpxP family protein refolding chaperone
MKPIWLWIALLLSVGVNLGVLATVGTTRLREPARWDRGARPEGPPPVERAADRLGLEGEKREAFIQIQTDFFQDMHESRQELESLRQGLRRELMAESPDRATVDRLVVEMGDAYAGLDRVFVDNVLKSREVLGPEQEQRYLAFLERLRQHDRSGPRRLEGPPRKPRSRRP